MGYDDPLVDRILARHKKLVHEKEMFYSLYTLVGKYVMTRKQNFRGEKSPGTILTTKVFDGTAGRSAQMLASSLLGALFPNAAKTFLIGPPDTMDSKVAEAKDVKEWYEYCSKRQATIMDMNRASLSRSLIGCVTDEVTFGTAGVGIWENEDDDDMPISYSAVDCKQVSISEGPDGFIDTCYIELEYTPKQLIQIYEWENVSDKVRELYSNGGNKDKIKVLHAIEPRLKGDIPGQNYGDINREMPVMSIHIEVEEKCVLKTSGYRYMPVLVTRFWNDTGEVYGRSPATEAMPDILEVNLFREGSIVATEKMLRPPLIINDPDVLRKNKVDDSAGGLLVRKLGGRQTEANNRPAAEPLITVQELQSTYKRIDVITDSIKEAFFIDRLTDLGNDTRMTLGEAQMRYEFRGQSLGTIYSRQISELFTPLIETTFNILWNRNFFGYMPDSPELLRKQERGENPRVIPQAIADMIKRGEDVYKIEYISPAVRIMQTEEMMGIDRTTDYILKTYPVAPNVVDNFDADKAVRRIQALTGASREILKDMETVKRIRDIQAKQQAEAMALQAENVKSESARNAGQAVQAVSKAQQ